MAPAIPFLWKFVRPPRGGRLAGLWTSCADAAGSTRAHHEGHRGAARFPVGRCVSLGDTGPSTARWTDGTRTPALPPR